MRISIPDDSEDLRSIRRERPPEPSRQPEPLLEPGPLDRRLERLRGQASQRNFPEIPRRQYERKIAPSPELSVEPGERHVRSRNQLNRRNGTPLHRQRTRYRNRQRLLRSQILWRSARTVLDSGPNNTLPHATTRSATLEWVCLCVE